MGISVITTSFNDSKNIKRYLKDILSQTLLPSEIIVVDGGSKDNTVAIIQDEREKYKEVSIKVVQDGHLNIAQGFNLGIKNAQYDLVCITCIGNTFPNDMLQKLLDGYKSGVYDACYGYMIGVDKGNFSRRYNTCFVGGDKGVPVMSNRCVLYNKKVFDVVGYFLEGFIYAGEDAEFLKSFKEKGLKAKCIPQVIVRWETPNSWDEYLKKMKFYSIGELQYDDTIKQFINKDSIFAITIFTLLILIVCDWQFAFVGIVLAIIRILYIVIKSRISIANALLALSRIYIKLFYKLKYIRYSKPSNKVTRI